MKNLTVNNCKLTHALKLIIPAQIKFQSYFEHILN